MTRRGPGTRKLSSLGPKLRTVIGEMRFVIFALHRQNKLNKLNSEWAESINTIAILYYNNVQTL